MASDKEKPRRIERDLGSIDDRLPYPIYISIARQQADAMPYEIVEDGLTYQIIDVRFQVDGFISTAIGIYEAIE